jgi:hypothetical protein
MARHRTNATHHVTTKMVKISPSTHQALIEARKTLFASGTLRGSGARIPSLSDTIDAIIKLSGVLNAENQRT